MCLTVKSHVKLIAKKSHRVKRRLLLCGDRNVQMRACVDLVTLLESGTGITIQNGCQAKLFDRL